MCASLIRCQKHPAEDLPEIKLASGREAGARHVKGVLIHKSCPFERGAPYVRLSGDSSPRTRIRRFYTVDILTCYLRTGLSTLALDICGTKAFGNRDIESRFLVTTVISFAFALGITLLVFFLLL